MNIFGAFTFGSLIKTFLPGFVWLIAILILDAFASQIFGKRSLWAYAQTKDQAALVLAIPISILLGLISNIIVFMGINDWLVRKPVRSRHPALFALYDKLAAQLQDTYWSGLRCADNSIHHAFKANVDVEYILLEKVGVEKLAYVREQYWYHLEFQMNLLLSVAATGFSLLLLAVLQPRTLAGSLTWILLDVAVTGFVGYALVLAARKNYCRHIAKMTSLIAAVLGQPAAPEKP